MLQFYVRLKLVCCSCICRGLETRLCILPLILDLLWRERFSDFPLFIGFSPLWPILCSFSNLVAIPAISLYYSCHGVFLTRACWASLRPAAYSSLNDTVWSLDLYSCYFGLS